jgi:outer membrane biosynthesis protein TonB
METAQKPAMDRYPVDLLVSNKQPSATASLVTKTKTSWFLPAHLLSLCLDPADFVLYSRRIRLKVLSLSKGPPNMDHLNISSSLIHTLSCTFANMIRKGVTKEQFARLKQRSQERPAAQTTEEPNWKPLDDEIHRLVQQPGAVSRLRSYVRTSKSLTPTPTKTRVAVHNAALLKTALIKRWGEDKWEEMIVSSPKPGKMVSYPKLGEATEDSKMKKLDEEIHRLIKKPGAAAMLRNAVRYEKTRPPTPTKTRVAIHNAALLKTALIHRWGDDKWEEMIGSSPKPGGSNDKDKHIAFSDQDSDSSHTLTHEEAAALAEPASNDSIFDRALDLLEASSGREPFGYAMGERRRARERAAELHKAGIAHPVFGAPGVPGSANSRIERARERAREATFQAERKAFALQQRKELASKQRKSRLSPHSSLAKSQWAREEIARLQALDQLQHELTVRALRIVLRTYPGETAHEHSKRLDMAISYLRETKVAYESNPVTLRQMERERAALVRSRLSAIETLSVQQMHRAMHRPQGIQLSAPMTEAVRDFLEQFPEGTDLSPEVLARREGMLPAIVAAIRTANDAELENDKKIAAAAEAASKKLASKGPVKRHTVWKPTESAVLIIEATQPEPTTPVHQTRSGALPSTPTAPKKPPPKKPTKKPAKKSTEKPTPTKKKPEPKAPKSAKPTGIQKATPPATPAGMRKSSRIIAQSVPARARASDPKIRTKRCF